MGLYLAGWWRGLAALERAGSLVWRRIEPVGRRLLPVRSPAGALVLGLLWGWLPCGLVYSALAWAFASGGAGQGALVMLAFGAGTLPTLLALGGAGTWLVRMARTAKVRVAIGTVAILFGVYAAAMAFTHQHQHSHKSSASIVAALAMPANHLG